MPVEVLRYGIRDGGRITAEAAAAFKDEARRRSHAEQFFGHIAYRIEWDDGHTTSYTPAAGALYPARKPAATTS